MNSKQLLGVLPGDVPIFPASAVNARDRHGNGLTDFELTAMRCPDDPAKAQALDLALAFADRVDGFIGKCREAAVAGRQSS
jgi:hypothetical protein